MDNRHATEWVDPGQQFADLDLIDFELKEFLKQGESAKAWKLASDGSHLNLFTVYAPPGLRGFAIGKDTDGAGGAKGQAVWNPNKKRYDVFHCEMCDGLMLATIVGTLGVDDGETHVTIVYGGRSYRADNPWHQSGGGLAIVLPKWDGSGPEDVLFRVIIGTGSVQEMAKPSYDLASGSWQRAIFRSYLTSVSSASTESYITAAPPPDDEQRDDTTIAFGSASPSSPVWGQNVTLTATVSHSVGVADPTGNVSFTANGKFLGYGTVGSGGVATIDTTGLGPGTQTIAVTYLGDSSYKPSGDTHDVTVDKADTTTVLTLSPTSATYGDALAMTATVTINSPGGGIPAGRVAFYDGTTLINYAACTSGTAILTVSSILAGSRTLKATFEPADYYFHPPETNTSDGTHTITIAKKPLTVVPNDCSMGYGADRPTFTPHITGFVNGDTDYVVSGAPDFTCSADHNSTPGTYAIHVAVGSLAADNYSFSSDDMHDGTLTVNRAVLTASADGNTVLRNRPIPALTGSISGVANGDVLHFTCTTNAVKGDPPGTYVIDITVTGSKIDCYVITYTQGVLTIT